MISQIKNKLQKQKGFAVIGCYLFFCLFLYSCGSYSAEKQDVGQEEPSVEQPQPDKIAVGEAPATNFSENPSIQEISDSLSIKLKRRSPGFFSELITMSEEKTYNDGDAKLVRQYSWNVSFPVTVSMGDVLVFPKKGTDKILVTINKLKIGQRFSFGNEQALTLSNEGWVTDSSEDQKFWKDMDRLSKKNMPKLVFNNKKVTNKMRNTAINLVVKEINEALAGTGAAENEFEFIINRISY